MTKISIIVLTYNHEKFISQNLESIFTQSVDADVEVIICDDFSKDNTVKIIENTIVSAPQNFDVKFFAHQKNLGATPNFYFALKQVTGNYIAFCEGDDYWTDPGKLQDQVIFLQENPDYSICFHAAKNTSDESKINGSLFSIISNRDYSQIEIYKHWLIHTATVMMKAEVLSSAAKENTMQDNSLQYFDTILFLSAGSMGKIRGSYKVMSAYRRHEAGLSAGKINFNRDLQHNKLDKIIGNYYGGEIKKLADWKIFSRSFQDFRQSFKSLKWKTVVAFLPWLFRNRIIFYYLLLKANKYKQRFLYANLRQKIVINYIILPIILVLATIKQTSKPHYNWDVVFYVGTIFNSAEPDITHARTQTVEALHNSKYIDYFNEIKPRTQYGIDVLTKNQAYKEQFPFYNMRIIYTGTIRAFNLMGIDPVYSVYLSSLFYAVLLLMVFYLFILITIKNSWFAFITTLTIIIKPEFKTFITSSPDTLSAFAIVCLTISYFAPKKKLFLLLSIFAIISRTDNIIYVVILIAFDIFIKLKNKKGYKDSIINISAVLLIYVTIGRIYNNAGYGLLFYHTFIDHLSYPISNPQKVSLAEWMTVIKENILYLIHPTLYLILCAIIITKNGWNSFTNPAMVVAITTILTFSIKFLLFPSTDSRFVFQYFILAIIIIIFYFKKDIRKIV